MFPNKSMWDRIALIAEIAERLKSNGVGRTAFMKLLYFLKTVRNVALPYEFELYTYGHFDSSVLGDLNYAESLGAVTSEIVLYPRGYGYVYRPAKDSISVRSKSSDFLNQHDEDIRWVVDRFGGCSAAELELYSTIVFVDRQIAEDGSQVEAKEIASKVRQVKPHFAEATIFDRVEMLSKDGLLKALA